MLKFQSESLELQDEDSNEHMVKFYYHALVQGWALEPGIKAIERLREVLLQLKMERVNTYKKEINGKGIMMRREQEMLLCKRHILNSYQHMAKQVSNFMPTSS